MREKVVYLLNENTWRFAVLVCIVAAITKNKLALLYVCYLFDYK
jgi:hypothetical protein